MHVGTGTFFQNLGNARPDADVYAHELSMADLAEPLGFDSVWAAEHHFTDYTMCPDPSQLLTWIAGRTKRVQLGTMVMVLPWHDPIRLAEEVCVLDHMSQGRVLLGLGRGLGRVEFDGFRLEMAESRGRFNEYAEAILTGLETGKMRADGPLYHQPPVDLRPAPFRSFRNRTWASAISPETSGILARLGVGIMVLPQKPWETIEADIAGYRDLYREINDEEAPKPLLASWVAVHESEAAAQDMLERWIMGYCDSVLQHYEFANAGLAEIPGYEYYGKLAANIAKHGKEKFTRFLADLQVWGTAEQVAEELIANVRRIDAGGLIVALGYGGMPFDVAQANQRRFAEHVLPRLKGIDVGPPLGQPASRP